MNVCFFLLLSIISHCSLRWWSTYHQCPHFWSTKRHCENNILPKTTLLFIFPSNTVRSVYLALCQKLEALFFFFLRCDDISSHMQAEQKSSLRLTFYTIILSMKASSAVWPNRSRLKPAYNQTDCLVCSCQSWFIFLTAFSVLISP